MNRYHHKNRILRQRDQKYSIKKAKNSQKLGQDDLKPAILGTSRLITVARFETWMQRLVGFLLFSVAIASLISQAEAAEDEFKSDSNAENLLVNFEFPTNPLSSSPTTQPFFFFSATHQPQLKIPENLLSISREFHKLLEASPKYYEVFDQQGVWIKEIFTKELPKFFPIKLLNRCFEKHESDTNHFSIHFASSTEIEPRYRGARANTERVSNLIYLFFDEKNSKDDLLLVLCNEIQHKLVGDTNIRKLKDHRHIETIKFTLPALNQKGQTDSVQFDHLKGIVDKTVAKMHDLYNAVFNNFRIIPAHVLTLIDQLLTVITDYSPKILRQWLNENEVEEFRQYYKKDFPSIEFFATTPIKNGVIIRYRLVKFNASPKDKLKALLFEFEHEQKIINNNPIYQNRGIEHKYAETAGNLDSHLPMGKLKWLLMPELCEYMNDFHASVMKDQEPMQSLHYCGLR